MKSAKQALTAFAVAALSVIVNSATAQDSPQWRGPNRDGKAPAFKAPAAWPASLTKKWDKQVGDGDAGVSLVGDRLYVFSKQAGDEAYEEIFHPIAERLLEKCDAVLRVGGASTGADLMVEVARKHGLQIYTKLEQIPAT